MFQRLSVGRWTYQPANINHPIRCIFEVNAKLKASLMGETGYILYLAATMQLQTELMIKRGNSCVSAAPVRLLLPSGMTSTTTGRTRWDSGGGAASRRDQFLVVGASNAKRCTDALERRGHKVIQAIIPGRSCVKSKIPEMEELLRRKLLEASEDCGVQWSSNSWTLHSTSRGRRKVGYCLPSGEKMAGTTFWETQSLRQRSSNTPSSTRPSP